MIRSNFVGQFNGSPFTRNLLITISSTRAEPSKTLKLSRFDLLSFPLGFLPHGVDYTNP